MPRRTLFAPLVAAIALLAVAALAGGCGGGGTGGVVFLPPSTTLAENAFRSPVTPFGTQEFKLRTTAANQTFAFTLETGPKFRRLKIDAQGRITADATVTTHGAGFGGVQTSLFFAGDTSAIMTTAPFGGGGAAEGLSFFNPLAIASASDVTFVTTNRKVDLGGTFFASDGSAVTSVTPLITASVTVAAGKLFVATTNLEFAPGPGAFIRALPGTVLVYPYDASKNIVATTDPSRAIVTTRFNPNGLRAFTSGGRSFVLAVLTGRGSINASGGIDVIDASLERVLGHIPLGVGEPFLSPPQVATRPDGKIRGFVGSNLNAHVYEFDLTNIHLDLPTTLTQPVTLTRLVHDDRDPIVVPFVIPGGTAPGFNFTPDIAVSASGRVIYAVNFNASTVTAFDITRSERGVAPPVLFQSFHGRAALNRAAAGTDFADFVEVRSGTPGLDFLGPDLFVATLAANAGAEDAIDAITTDPAHR